jgi:beta-phosphoglucomutase
MIFDMDGVLVDTAEPHFESWRMAGRELGFEMTEDLFHETFGMTNQRIAPIVFGREVTPEEVTEMADLKEGYYREIVADRVRIVPGVLELIEDMERSGNWRLAVGSSTPIENVELILEIMGMRESFDALVAGGDVEHGKPDPDAFLLAADRLGLRPKACLVAEDAPVGIEAALAADMKCVAVSITHAPEMLGAAHVVREDFVGFTAEDAASLIES